jgi:hypothetical protein
MTNSPSSRPNQLLSEAPQTGADQDSIIPRALNAFIDQARSANAQGNQVERAVWLQAALMLQSDRPETGLDLIDAMLKQNRIGDGIHSRLNSSIAIRNTRSRSGISVMRSNSPTVTPMRSLSTNAPTRLIQPFQPCATTWRSPTKSRAAKVKR